MSRSRALLLAACLGLVSLGCGGNEAAPPRRAAPEQEPSWSDIFDDVPDVLVVMRPGALRRDPFYGSFWTALVRSAEARGFVRGSTMIEAVEGASEIIVALDRGSSAIVLRGVPASLDPQRINDAAGQPLFRPLSDRGRIAELELVDRREAAGSLFVLPNRTWVGVLGEARAKARQVFVAPTRKPPPKIDPDALAVVRIGAGLIRLGAKHPRLGPLAKRLTSVTFTLRPGKEGLVVGLAYQDADAVAWGEMQAKRLAAELAQEDARFGWLKDAKIAYEASTNTVLARVAVPPRLLEELPKATGADLGL